MNKKTQSSPRHAEKEKKSSVDPKFKREVSSAPGGEHLLCCFACGTCALSCPVAEVEPEYSPRRIIHSILLGLKEEVLGSEMIWYCLACGRCHARCPQEVNFPEIVRALRRMALEQGYATPEKAQALREIDREAQEKRRDTLKERLGKARKTAGKER